MKQLYLFRYFLTALTMLLVAYPVFSNTGSRGLHKVTLEARSTSGERVKLYRESHALLVGVSKYTNGWSNLDSIPGELDRVQKALEAKGFNVIRVSNPDSEQLRAAFRNFVNEYGYSTGARLLFYFSGHGHSDKDRGFIVPADAPLPDNRREFLQKSLQMSQVTEWARQIDSDHALFVFDSCFSGSIFKSRNMPSASERLIRKATSKPVRQFITAGSAGEIVPSKSVFTPAFVDAIDQNLGDLNKDGYITGSELGLYLTQTVPGYVDQSPQYGKIKDYELAQGDFVFFGQGTPASNPTPITSQNYWEDGGKNQGSYLTNIKITQDDRKLIWQRMKSLKWAIENKNMETIDSVADLPSDKRKLFADLFNKYKKIDVELGQLSENPKKGTMYGDLRLKRFQRKDGSFAYPINEIRDNRLVVRRNKNGWTSFQW